MPHPHTARLFDVWRAGKAPGRALPDRVALSPLLMGPLAPQMFVLAELAPGAWRLRTAGALLDDLHGRALAGEDFLALWDEADRNSVRRALEGARALAAPRALTCRAETRRGRAASLELTLLPAAGPTGAPDRCVGLYQPLSPLARLGGQPLDRLRLVETALSRPRLVVDNTRPGPLA